MLAFLFDLIPGPKQRWMDFFRRAMLGCLSWRPLGQRGGLSLRGLCGCAVDRGAPRGSGGIVSPREKLVIVHLSGHSSYVRSTPIGRLIAQLCLFSAGDLAFVPVAG